MIFRVGILTVSDRGAQGLRQDESGEAIANALPEKLFSVEKRDTVPDEIENIREKLSQWVKEGIHLILTTGGTGLSPRDVTPQAMEGFLDYEVPGIAEAMRSHGLKYTPFAMLSRAKAGVKGSTLIINLPGSKKAALEGLEAILPALSHGLEKLLGDTRDCGG